ncbi:MAG: hypothetical protein HC827_17530 [Cyanobacteria bacterium RM1_2_2]|nr:hypothetical protein [Cyanobacteria bacterium RM1_2_2]
MASMRQSLSQKTIWFLLSLAIPLYFGLISLHYAFSQDYLIQDDARLHIVWLQQLVDSDLFPADLLANYYQTIQATGFKAFYWIMAQVGISPLLLAKLLPPFLALIATGYLFHLTLLLLPMPACGFLTTLLLNQNIWLKDDLISATPRAFIYPLFTAFLYYLLRRSPVPLLIALTLTSLFYPQVALVELGILTLRLWSGESRKNYKPYALWLTAVILVGITVLPFQQQITAQFGEILTAAEMQQMPEFGLNGRREYFGVDPVSFAFRGASGLRLPLFPPILWASLGLPILLRTQSPTVNAMTSEVKLLLQIGVASVTLFLLAHLLFPQLYLPSRYTFYSFRIGMPLAAGIVLWIGLAAGWRWWRRLSQPSFLQKFSMGLVSLFAVAVVVIPAIPALFLDTQGWIVGTQPQIYQFLAEQPKDTLIASLTPETDNLPAFTQRSVLVSRELALAYHPAFYDTMQQRMSDLLAAQYSSDLATLQAVIQKYGIDFWLLDQQFASPDYLAQQDWLRYSSVQNTVDATIRRLEQGTVPAIRQTFAACTAISENNLIVLKATCIGAVESE